MAHLFLTGSELLENLSYDVTELSIHRDSAEYLHVSGCLDMKTTKKLHEHKC